MSQIANLILNNGAVTPVAVTFTPAQSQGTNTPSLWIDKTNGSPLLYNRVTQSVTLKTTGVSKVKAVISLPKPANMGTGCCVDSNVPQSSYTALCVIEFSLPNGSTLDDRKNLLAFAKNYLSSTVAQDAIWNIEPAF